MTSKNFKTIMGAILALAVIALGLAQSGCGIYRFKDVSIPDSIRTVRVLYIENKATYVNPQLAPKLTDKLRQKIVGQTRLKQTNNDDADWDIIATIKTYSFSTAGISNQQVSMNKLNVNIEVVVDDKRAGKRRPPQAVSRSFDYPGSMALQQAEKNLESDMLRDLSDDIFNRIFSNW